MRFAAGNSGGGRPAGSRNRITSAFLTDLLEAWQRDGKAALRVMAKQDPTRFVQCVATLMPRQVELDVNGPLSEMTDEEVADALAAIRRLRAEMVQPAVDIDPKAISGPQTICMEGK